MGSVKNNTSVNNASLNAAKAPSKAPRASKAGKVLDKIELAYNAVKPSPGHKLTVKVASGGVATVGILGFAGYGMYAAAPHIGALFGTIAASPIAVPILATIGAVLGAVAIVLVIRKIYKAVQKNKVIKANTEAAKRSAEALANNPTLGKETAPDVSAVQTQQVVPSFEGTPSVRSGSTMSFLTPLEKNIQETLAGMTEATIAEEVEKTKDSLATYDVFFAGCTPAELAGEGDATKLAEIETYRNAQEQCTAFLQMAGVDPAVYV